MHAAEAGACDSLHANGSFEGDPRSHTTSICRGVQRLRGKNYPLLRVKNEAYNTSFYNYVNKKSGLRYAFHMAKYGVSIFLM